MKKSTLKEEIVKCGTDPEYFIQNYVKIQHPVRGLIPFNPFEYQSGLLKAYQEHRFNIILKARQLGITELTAAYAAWMILFRRDKNVVVIATKRDTAKEIIRRIHTTIKYIPKWLMLSKMTANNVFSIELANGSRVKAVSTARDAGRSEAGSLLIIDEAAHIENMEEIWTGLRPVVSAGGQVIMLSTPLGVGNTFHKLFVGAEKEENEFFPTTLMWWLHPEHIIGEDGRADLVDDRSNPSGKSSAWFRMETSGLSTREIAQEYCCNFNASGDTFLDHDYIQRIEEQEVIDPNSREWIDRNLWVWEEFNPDEQYFICADVARGDGRDNSASPVFEVSSMRQVAEYYGKIPVDDFAHALTYIGEKYGNAMIVFENNSLGMALYIKLKELEYENVYFSEKGDLKAGKSFSLAMFVPNMSEYVPGFTTSPKTRPLILQKLEEFIRTEQIIIRSRRTLEEFKKFVWVSGRAQAQRGYNDDLVMSIAVACWIRDTFFSSTLMSHDITKKMLNMTSFEKTDHTQIPGAAKDPQYVKKNERLCIINRDPYSLSLPNGEKMDLGWLIKVG